MRGRRKEFDTAPGSGIHGKTGTSWPQGGEGKTSGNN